MTIISRARLCGAFAGVAMLIGAMHGHAEAELTTNSLSSNALSSNALSSNALTANSLTVNALTASGARHDAATPGVGALHDLNGVAVEGVVLPMAARP